MQSLGSSLTVAGAEVGKLVAKKVAVTIPATGWSANAGDYVQHLDFAISGVLATDVVDVTILPDYIDIAVAAGLAPYVEEYAGGITFYASAVPGSAINVKYNVWR